jgi:hypothetical protein
VAVETDASHAPVLDGNTIAAPVEATGGWRVGAREQARLAAEEAARAEAVRRAAEGRVSLLDPAVDDVRGAWLERVGDQCVHWVSMAADEKVVTADMLTAEVVETVRVAQQLPADAGHVEVLAGAAASIDEICEESLPERGLIEVTISLYGR